MSGRLLTSVVRHLVFLINMAINKTIAFEGGVIMNKVLIPILLVISLVSGAFSRILEFSVWLFCLKDLQQGVSLVGDIIVRALTFIVSYALLGLAFNYIGVFNKKIMSKAYLLISSIIGVALSFLVWSLEQSTLFFIIAFAICIVVVLTFTVAVTKKIKKAT